MDRDMDLARQLLIEIREKSTNDKPLRLKIEGRTEDEISYHIEKMAEARLVNAISMPKGRIGSIWLPISLTWEGHEFLDAAADDTTWNKAKAFVKTNTGGVTFELLKGVLLAWAKKKVGL